MNQVAKNLKSTTFSGRRFTRKQIKQIQSTVNSLPNLSRRELANTVCEHFDWLTPSGKNRSQACLNALEKMEAVNLFSLPPKIESNVRGKKPPLIWTSSTDEQPSIEDELQSVLPIQIIHAVDLADCNLWNEYVDRYHYLGYKHPIGSNLRYFIVDKHGRKLGCLSFSFASRVLPDRDNWIGWGINARQKRLNRVINNNRYLIFPWVDIKYLASKALSMACQQLPNDWDFHHGYKPLLVETFVDTEKYKGTCYRAANWEYIGKTDGVHRGQNGERKSIKEIYVYPLEKNCKVKLINGERTTKKRKSPPARFASHDNNDPFVHSWQKIISMTGKTCDTFDLKWRKRKRLINTLLLVLFIFRLVFSKNKQGYHITIAELWHQCKLMGVDLPQKALVAASAFCTARTKLDENIFKVINTQIIDSYEVSGEDDKWHGRRVFAVDGTKMNLPRPLLKSGYKLPHENSHYPFGLVSCLYQLRSKIPIDFDLMPGTGERTYALAHLTKLVEGDVVVYDRGYFSYSMLYWHLKKKIHPIFRMPYQTYPAIVNFIDSEKTDEIVEILLTQKKFTKIRKKDSNIDVQSLKIRLIKYRIGDESYTLGTTLFDKEFDGINEFSKLYHERWDIEELYKISKVLIEVQDFHAQSERGIKQELYAHFVMITLSRIFSNHIENEFFKKLNDEPDRRTRVNMKYCLITIARNLETLFIQQRLTLKKTICDMVNSIMTCRKKERPNRSYERRSKKPFSKWQASQKVNKPNLTPAM
ncbi:MAG: IS4 family transposase [Pseudomonadales bacterium]